MAHILSQSLARGSFSGGSDNEEINTSALRKRHDDGVIVAGELPESDEEEEGEEQFEDATDTTPGPSPSSPMVTSVHQSHRIIQTGSNVQKNEFQSLLHRKLRERNDRFHKELVALNRNPYRESFRMVDESVTAASRSLKIVSDSSTRVKRLRDDMYLLKVAYDRLLINSSALPRFKAFQGGDYSTNIGDENVTEAEMESSSNHSKILSD